MFVAGLIPSMSRRDMRIIYRLLLEARERDDIPWDWIVDETRLVERVATWDDANQFASDMASEYRHNFWKEQPNRVEVWSEKGTVGGVLRPTLRAYGVDFRIMHGFGSATVVHDVAQDYDGRDLVALYVGDFDPSGLYMSERDLPDRLTKYDGSHVILKRVALKSEHTADLPSFPASDKTKDPRHKWFVQNHGHDCWELDAGPEHAARPGRRSDQGRDRAGSVEALRHREQGHAGVDAVIRRCLDAPRRVPGLRSAVRGQIGTSPQLLPAAPGLRTSYLESKHPRTIPRKCFECFRGSLN
jgi:hypothetical protein